MTFHPSDPVTDPFVSASAVPDLRPSAMTIAGLALADVVERMTPTTRRGALAVAEFLSRPNVSEASMGDLVETMCRLMIAAGVPIDRYGSATTMVTSEHDAISRIWRRDEGLEQTLYVRPADEDDGYLNSPFHQAAQSRQWVELWIAETEDARFGIVASLRAQGIVHYLCIPVFLFNGTNGWTTFATKRPSGFSEQDLLAIALIAPALACRIDARVGWSTLDKLLRTYVGDEPHKAILAGRAKRGQVTTIEAAMLVADLRDSTGHTANMSALQAVDLFNELFDCLVPQIESRRGEVLKYLGDGLLAMFRETDDVGGACDRALSAANDALRAVRLRNVATPERRPIEIGIALHFGEIAYGNVGSGVRLDFTVIGRDVALATRIAGLNAKLEQPLLLSASFAARVSRPSERVGLYPVRGFEQMVEVFRPSVSEPVEPAVRAHLVSG